MNPSRISYSYPVDYNQAFPKCVILSPCEFCHRTFIPDSLNKHRKVCYKEYLKKKSQDSKKPNFLRTKSAQNYSGDLPGMTSNDLMLKRQIRRMHWRGRHEEFIQSIREAREYAIASENGLKVIFPSISIDSRENMQQCKYCLRHFQKDSFDKHLMRCKEYSIRSYRSKPNEAQIEAKRRLSLRLYYKPKAFRGDSPDDLSTTVSSNDFDCLSTATIDSRSTAQLKSRASSSISNNAKVKRQTSVSIPKSQEFLLKRHKSTTLRKLGECEKSPSNSVKNYNSRSCCDYQQNISQSQTNLAKIKAPITKKDLNDLSNMILTSENQNRKSIINDNNFHRVLIEDCDSSSNSRQSNRSNKNDVKSEILTHKLKVISNILNTPINNQNNTARPLSNIENLSKYEFPNPAISLKRAKEILKFLDVRMQENERFSLSRHILIENESANIINNQSNPNLYEDPFDDYLENSLSKLQNVEKSSPPEISHIESKIIKNISVINTTDQESINYQNCKSTNKIENKYEKLYKNVNVNDTVNNESSNRSNKSENIYELSGIKSDNAQSSPSLVVVHTDPEYARIWKK